MRAQDLALIAFRLLALWIAVSGLAGLLEVLLSWGSLAATMLSATSGVGNPPTRAQLFWMTSSAMAARAGVGALLWCAAPPLARRTCPGDARVSSTEGPRAALYWAAALLVGVWLLSEALPGLAFVAYAATRPGVAAYDDGLGGARTAELVAKLVLGVAFIRGGWLVGLAIGKTPNAWVPEESEGG